MGITKTNINKFTRGIKKLVKDHRSTWYEKEISLTEEELLAIEKGHSADINDFITTFQVCHKLNDKEMEELVEKI